MWLMSLPGFYDILLLIHLQVGLIGQKQQSGIAKLSEMQCLPTSRKLNPRLGPATPRESYFNPSQYKLLS